MNKVKMSKKVKNLNSILNKYESIAIALSGGIDSLFLLMLAKKIYKKNLLAITAKSIIHFNHDLEDAKRITAKLEVRHIFFNSYEINIKKFIKNRKNRCYFCKRIMLEKLCYIANKNGFNCIAHGANLDDIKDYRPGLKAVNEFKVISPFVDASFSKKDIRRVARFYRMDLWNKSSTGCLATRIPYHNKIKLKKINNIKKAELALMNFGFKICRVRHYDSLAKIEINIFHSNNFELLLLIREKIVMALKKVGYEKIFLDLEGYKQGNMNLK